MKSFRVRYVLIGALLGVGAPLGALLLRLLMTPHGAATELEQNGFFYAYMLIGTSLIFALAGVRVGARADRLRRDRDRFLELSEHDELTMLLNTRAFWSRYRRAVDRTIRYGEPISLLVLDLDFLKKLNDLHGHRFGDEALKHVARVLEQVKRDEDDAARWGGDEFVVLMPGAPLQAAVRLADEILRGVNENPVTAGELREEVTVTIGIAAAEGEEGAAGLFERADQALFQGKRGGRNRYWIAGGESGMEGDAAGAASADRQELTVPRADQLRSS
jgi:diguanylate cyclase (GGDEF)-like protein